MLLKGWLYGKRSSGKLQFLQIRDGTGTIQGVLFKGEVPEELFAAVDKLPQEASIIVTGTVKKDTRSALGFELGLKDVVVVQAAENYPISPKDHGVAFLMEHRHLWVRSARQHAILRIRHTIIKAIRDYFDDHGYTLLDAPIFTPAACEGTSTLFEVPYFDLGKAFLTQSGQLYGEAAAMAVGKAYVFGPTFRAEKSKTRRHLTEFWMVEPEVAYMDLAGDMDLAEDFLGEHRRAGPRPPRARARVRARARRRAAQEGAEALPAHHLHRGHRAHPKPPATPWNGGATSAATRRRSSPTSSIGPSSSTATRRR